MHLNQCVVSPPLKVQSVTLQLRLHALTLPAGDECHDSFFPSKQPVNRNQGKQKGSWKNICKNSVCEKDSGMQQTEAYMMSD